MLSCKNSSNIKAPESLNPDLIKEEMLQANKHLVDAENEQINSLIRRHGWKMQQTGTGLRYIITGKGNGPRATQGQIVRINYEVRLISGDLVYSSDQTGPKEFKIGSGGVESGLEEAILLLRKGDQAKLVIPSYLAHGLAGDQDKIPPKATLIYEVEIIDLFNPNK
jgi:FKBP-type peptidyl-prolyl cis-trans isomerase FkpA